MSCVFWLHRAGERGDGNTLRKFSSFRFRAPPSLTTTTTNCLFASQESVHLTTQSKTSKKPSKKTSSQKIVVGVDIGGTKVALIACDMKTGDELARDTFSTPDEAKPLALLDQVGEEIDKLVSQVDCTTANIGALGVAVPGPVDVEDGRVILAGNLPGWRDVPLRDTLRRRFNLPVWIDQDANAAALGEHWRGSAKSMNNFVFLALGTGVGAGVFINGRLHRGYNNYAGEVGNFIMGRQHLRKDRDGHGNLELLIGGPSIRKEARKVVRKDLSAAEAIDLADEDRRLKPVADRVIDYLAITVINITSLLDPQAIIFGGGTASAGPDLVNRIRTRVEHEIRVAPTLMHSVLGEDAQLHGAVFGALWELDPKLALREELR
jgi:glucokinase